MAQPMSSDELQQRQARAKRTALIAGAIALAVYVAFMLSGVFGG